MNDYKDDLISYRINRAYETLKEAEAMIEKSYWNAAVNRIYYSCYYAVSGLFLKNSINAKSHKGIRHLFGLNFVQTGIISRDFGKFFSDLFDKRHIGDYDDFITYNQDIVDDLIVKAKEFIDKIKELIYQD